MARIFRHHVSPVKLTLAFADFAVITIAAFAAHWLRYWSLDLVYTQSLVSILVKLVIPLVTVPILLGLGAYQSDAIIDLKVFFARLIIGLFAALLVLSAVAYFVPVFPLWRSILLLTMLLSGALLMIVHWLSLMTFEDSFLGKQVVILGNNNDAYELVKQTAEAPEAGLKVVEIINIEDETDTHLNEEVLPKVTKFSTIPNLLEYLKKVNCELIVIGSQLSSEELPIEDLVACKLSGIEVKDRLTFYEEVRGYVDLDSVKADWIVFAEGFKGANIFEKWLKRLLDIVVSSFLLILTFPILLIGMLLVKVTSRGPIFYRQERVGLDGESFNVMKLRSMRVNAETVDKPEFAKENDPRVTPVGGFIRRTRIDELPQILNVLRGDMSFVGPRPERPYFVEKLEETVPFYRERHCLKPGITGWAQIRYPYGASFEDSRRKLEYDLYYIKNYSLFLDILIILQTVRVILFPHGVR